MSKKYIPFFTLALMSLCIASPVPLRAVELKQDRLSLVPVPSLTRVDQPLTEVDLNGDSSPETLAVENDHLEILSTGKPVWQSPDQWQVLQADFTDLDQDEIPEITLLVWRPFQPWPVDRWLPHGGRIEGFHDAQGYSCHIILIGWKNGQFRELWAGSALAEPVRSFLAADLNGDGNQEMVAIEGDYSASRAAPGHDLKAWEWNGFGFSIVSQISGYFTSLASAHAGDGRTLILVP